MPKKGGRKKKKLNWFKRLFGFNEAAQTYTETQQLLVVDGDTITSKRNNKSYKIGHFATETLGEQRARVMKNEKVPQLVGKTNGLVLKIEVADVTKLHMKPSNRHATFQVASQFNCLEFMGPDVTPEDGITGYFRDRTQGPACSIACGAATAYRNYFAPVKARKGGVQIGQTMDLMIDNLKDFSKRVGNVRGSMFQMQGGYTIARSEGLAKLAAALEACDDIDALRDLIRVGVHSDVQVTSHSWGSKLIPPLTKSKSSEAAAAATTSTTTEASATTNTNTSDPSTTTDPPTYTTTTAAAATTDPHTTTTTTTTTTTKAAAAAAAATSDPTDEVHMVTQVFCSAVACNYNKFTDRNDWLPMAQIILDAAYEATFLAAIDAVVRHPGARGAHRVFLTLLGGGVFGNALTWILAAIRRACERYKDFDLEVIVVNYSQSVDSRITDLVNIWDKKRRKRLKREKNKKIKTESDTMTTKTEGNEDL